MHTGWRQSRLAGVLLRFSALLAILAPAAVAGTPALAKTHKAFGPTAALQPAHVPQSGPSYYLALGDSVPVWNGTHSYPNLILAHYQRKLPGLTLNNLAISGESTTSMLQGPQYSQALSFLKAHSGHIALITIDIGGNDIVTCAFSIATVDPGSPCSTQARATIRRNLTAILTGLHAVAPRVPVIGMSYYDPVLGDWLGGGAFRSLAFASLGSLVILNRELVSLYGGARNTADVQGVFRTLDFRHSVASQWGTVPVAVQRACAWLDIQCQAGGPSGFGDDPTDAGAVAIAHAFERKIDRLCVHRRTAVLRRC
jgi:lysophospholipase L1-like esterase